MSLYLKKIAHKTVRKTLTTYFQGGPLHKYREKENDEM